MKIFITGAGGTIGSVLMKCLAEKYECVGVDKKGGENVEKLDIFEESERMRELARGSDAVIHLAWDTREAGGSLESALPENKKMGERTYALALEEKIPSFLLASSVHAAFGHINESVERITGEDVHKNLHREKKITVDDGFYPLGAYGASKVYLEALGKAYSLRGLRVIAVRFGNVTPDDGHGEYPLWLSHRDCCQFVERCCAADDLPPFSAFFAISDNACNPFDIESAREALGYEPEDGNQCPFDTR